MGNHSEKVVDYTFQDFSEEFGYFSDDEHDFAAVEENRNTVFKIRGLDDLEDKEPLPEEVKGEEDLPDMVDDDLDMDEREEDPDHQAMAADAAALIYAESERILAEARSEADKIMNDALASAEVIRNNAVAEASSALSQAEQTGYNEGFEKGQAEGFQSAYEETRRELDEQNRSLLEEISRAIAELERQKTDYIRQYNEEMKDLVMAIAEKVIKISLKSSSEVIRRMILAAVETSRQKEWAKIYISEYDANLMVREDTDILDALRRVSDHVKVITMENGESGDLIVEFPDQAIDAGVNTQLENIRQIMSDSSQV